MSDKEKPAQDGLQKKSIDSPHAREECDEHSV